MEDQARTVYNQNSIVQVQNNTLTHWIVLKMSQDRCFLLDTLIKRTETTVKENFGLIREKYSWENGKIMKKATVDCSN
jgi:hypothetical protein